MLKFWRAIDRAMTSSIRRTFEIGRSASTARNSFWIAAVSDAGFPDVRTIHVVGMIPLPSRARASDICAAGTYMIGGAG